MKINYFKAINWVLVAFFCASIFINLGDFLLWNDEAETAMYGQRILQYGFPKVNDGKNIVNLTNHWDKGLGVKEQHDAWIHLLPGQYYVAAIGVFFANLVTNIYLKTFFVRLPFAIMGVLGIVFLGKLIGNFKVKNDIKYNLISLYYFLSLTSVFLSLHLKEARYYSIVIFCTGLATYIYFRSKINKISYWVYFILLVLTLLLLGISYFPGFIVIAFSLLTAELIYKFLNKEPYLVPVKNLLPVATVVVLMLPVLLYFEYFYVSSEFSKLLVKVVYGKDYFPTSLYYRNIYLIIEFLFVNENLFILVLLKSVIIGVIFFDRKKLMLIDRNLSLISLFIFIYSILLLIILARIPALFSRYFVVMVPIINLAIIVDLLIIFAIYRFKKDYVKAISIVLASVIGLSLVFKANQISYYLYEIVNNYEGPVDASIDEIIGRYDDPSKLIIATNYEELSYMFYLDSRVIIGGVGNNLEKDLEKTPDVIIPRKDWNYLKELKVLREGADYEEVLFTIYDYYFNNIAEPSRHLFKTKYAENEEEALKIYFKKDEK